MFADLKRIRAVKKFNDIEEVIAVNMAYFWVGDKWYYKMVSKSLKTAVIGVLPSVAIMLHYKMEFS